MSMDPGFGHREIWETMPMSFFQTLTCEIMIRHRFANDLWWVPECWMYYGNLGGSEITNFSSVLVPPNYVMYINHFSDSVVPTELPPKAYPYCPWSRYFLNNFSGDPKTYGNYVEYYLSYTINGHDIVCDPLPVYVYPQFSWFWPNPSDDVVASVLENPSSRNLVQALSERQGPKYLALKSNSKTSKNSSNAKKLTLSANSANKRTTSALRTIPKTSTKIVAPASKLQKPDMDELSDHIRWVSHERRVRLMNRDMFRICVYGHPHLPPTPPENVSSTDTDETDDHYTPRLQSRM